VLPVFFGEKRGGEKKWYHCNVSARRCHYKGGGEKGGEVAKGVNKILGEL